MIKYDFIFDQDMSEEININDWISDVKKFLFSSEELIHDAVFIDSCLLDDDPNVCTVMAILSKKGDIIVSRTILYWYHGKKKGFIKYDWNHQECKWETIYGSHIFKNSVIKRLLRQIWDCYDEYRYSGDFNLEYFEF